MGMEGGEEGRWGWKEVRGDGVEEVRRGDGDGGGEEGRWGWRR